jgi:hypothetical protein
LRTSWAVREVREGVGLKIVHPVLLIGRITNALPTTIEQGEPLIFQQYSAALLVSSAIYLCPAPSKNEIVIFISRGERLEMKR